MQLVFHQRLFFSTYIVIFVDFLHSYQKSNKCKIPSNIRLFRGQKGISGEILVHKHNFIIWFIIFHKFAMFDPNAMKLMI